MKIGRGLLLIMFVSATGFASQSFIPQAGGTPVACESGGCIDTETLQTKILPPPPLPPLPKKPLSQTSVVAIRNCIYPLVPLTMRTFVPKAGKDILVRPVAMVYRCWDQIWFGETTIQMIRPPKFGSVVTIIPDEGLLSGFHVDMTGSTKNKDFFVCRVSFVNRPYPYRILTVYITKTGAY